MTYDGIHSPRSSLLIGDVTAAAAAVAQPHVKNLCLVELIRIYSSPVKFRALPPHFTLLPMPHRSRSAAVAGGGSLPSLPIGWYHDRHS